MWRCAACGEENEPQFDACWKCQAEGPPAEERPLAESVPPPPAPSAPRAVPLGRLVGRSFLDIFLASILPFVVTVPALAGASNRIFFLAVLLFQPALLAVALWRRRVMVRAGEAVAPLREGSRAESTVVGVLLGALLAWTGILYVKLIGEITGERESPWEFGDSTVGKVLEILLAAVAAPVFEEMLFRGAILGSFAASGRTGWGLLVSGLLFAAAHLKPEAIPLYFVDSMLFGWAFLKTRSIRTPIIAHAVVNALVYALG